MASGPFESAKKSFAKTSDVAPSKSLVTFDGTKLRLSENLVLSDPTVRVVSILGKARMGKSTFLNSFVSKFTQVDSLVFTTADGIEHCTYGVDYCYIPEQKLLLLDSQGLANGDARHDPALLLFIYLVSNLVIFNDSKILQNEALKLIEPICTFTQYLDMDSFVKPILMFRLSDGKLVKDAQKNLDNVMAHHEDQYNSIRESIENVFQDPVRIVKTETLKEGDERNLAAGSYLGLLASKENGFDDAVTTIMDIVRGTDPRANILSDLPAIIEKINGNEQIKIEKLDVVALVHENAIREWLDQVPADLKADITVDGTQASFDNLVVPRKASATRLKTEFTKKFKAISETIKKKHKTTLDLWLDGPIKKAIALCETKAMESVRKAGLEGLEKDAQLAVIKDVYMSMSDSDEVLLKRHLGAWQRFADACSAIYRPIKETYENWVGGINSEMVGAIKQAREAAETQKKIVQEYIEKLLTGFDDWALTEIMGLGVGCCQLKNKVIMEELRMKTILELQQFVKKNVKKQDIQLSMTKSVLDVLWVEDNTEASTDYPLISGLVVAFMAELFKKPDAVVIEALVEKKQSLLYGKLFTNPVLGKQYYTNNPEIMFVFDKLLLNTVVYDKDGAILKSYMPYMTMRTWTEMCQPMYDAVYASLVEDGLLVPPSWVELQKQMLNLEKSANDANITEVTSRVANDMYHTHLNDFFVVALKKLYCKNHGSPQFAMPVSVD